MEYENKNNEPKNPESSGFWGTSVVLVCIAIFIYNLFIIKKFYTAVTVSLNMYWALVPLAFAMLGLYWIYQFIGSKMESAKNIFEMLRKVDGALLEFETEEKRVKKVIDRVDNKLESINLCLERLQEIIEELDPYKESQVKSELDEISTQFMRHS